MKRATEKCSNSQGKKKKSDWAEFLKTYDPSKEDSDSSEEKMTKESFE
ncbi:hypothetical protein A2U01_0085640, partial [Trifolium medium]|nr:hypothetical protein [Trifolium medium]